MYTDIVLNVNCKFHNLSSVYMCVADNKVLQFHLKPLNTVSFASIKPAF